MSICLAAMLGVSLLWLSSVSLAQADLTPSELPRLEFVQGSVEEACGLNSFPRYSWLYRFQFHDWGIKRRKNYTFEFQVDWGSPDINWKSLEVEEIDWEALEGEECQIALDKHIDSMNPYLWGGDADLFPNFAFVEVEEPLTFGRIFADPTGDFSRVRDVVMNHHECLLREEETNWDLKDACHASAFFNYALINRFCFGGGAIDRRLGRYPDGYYDLTLVEQDRSNWKADLEEAWVRERCEQVPSYLELDSEHNFELSAKVSDLLGSTPGWHSLVRLIELSARLGDEAAGLTAELGEFRCFCPENGARYGRFATLLTSDEWRAFAWKSVPSTDRLLKTFHMLDFVLSHHTNYPDEIDFDWEFVAEHLCRPTFVFNLNDKPMLVQHQEYPSCKEVVQEIREREELRPEISDIVDKVEQIARSIGVYD